MKIYSSKNIIVCILFLLPFCLMGQKETVHTTFDLDAEMEDVMVPFQRSYTLKVLNLNRYDKDRFFIGNILFDEIDENKMAVYKNGKPKKALQGETLDAALNHYSLDTIYTFDNETFEEEIMVVENEIPRFPTENTVYDFQQEFIFRDNKLNLNIHSIGVKETNDENDPIFVIKNKSKEIDETAEGYLRRPQIVWAKNFYYTIPFENKKLRNALLSDVHFNKHAVVEPSEYDVINIEDIKKHLEGDKYTLLDYKPNEPNPKATVIQDSIRDERVILHFRICMDLYYDIETQSLNTKILAIAPQVEQYSDGGGDLLYYRTLFWIVYDDEFLKQ